MNDTIDTVARHMVDAAKVTYREHAERAALRCGTGDAAGLCDAIARFLMQQHRTKRGHLSVRGQELAQIAKMCGDEIWKMRDLI